MSQYRYGPVRAVQQSMPQSYTSGLTSLKQNMMGQQQQKRPGGASMNGLSGSKQGSLLAGSAAQKQRPSSSKPLPNSKGGLNMSVVGNTDNRPASSGGIRPASPGTGSALNQQNAGGAKKQRMRSSSPAVQTSTTGPNFVKAKQNPNQSFTGGSKVTNMSQMNKSLVP